ncbi:hypothetical protein GOODEAATRI_003723 [Goodea atripinnis]|uniref:Uncharacterized protein n=1 Tax=Goodea atripinnis TaxID=208336 RepID=A0ABV0NRJ8_9TELE
MLEKQTCKADMDDQIIHACRAAVRTGHAHMANHAAANLRSYLYKFSATFATSSGIFQAHHEIIGHMHGRQCLKQRPNVKKLQDATKNAALRVRPTVMQLRPAAQSTHLSDFITEELWENLLFTSPEETMITRARACFTLHTLGLNINPPCCPLRA